MNERFEQSGHDLPDTDDALSEAERDLLSQALLGSVPAIDPDLWDRMVAVATDPDTADPGVALVDPTTEGPFETSADTSDTSDADESRSPQADTGDAGNDDLTDHGVFDTHEDADYQADDHVDLSWTADESQTDTSFDEQIVVDGGTEAGP